MKAKSAIPPALVARLAKREDQHKYDHGHAVILSGGAGHTGAARLAARAALRVGAGLVTVGCPKDALPENAAHLTAIMLRRVDDAKGLTKLLEDQRLNALCLGPGLGLTDLTRDLVFAALAHRRATVLDADALTMFANDPAELFSRLHARTVITPHMGEFARLFPDEANAIGAAGTSETQVRRIIHHAAERAGCVILLKGARTRIADPSGQVVEHLATRAHAAPWLATAGTGDVLAGLVTGLFARGFAAMEAAQLGVFLHAEAARLAGPGLIAEDLPEQIPATFRALGL